MFATTFQSRFWAEATRLSSQLGSLNFWLKFLSGTSGTNFYFDGNERNQNLFWSETDYADRLKSKFLSLSRRTRRIDGLCRLAFALLETKLDRN